MIAGLQRIKIIGLSFIAAHVLPLMFFGLYVQITEIVGFISHVHPALLFDVRATFGLLVFYVFLSILILAILGANLADPLGPAILSLVIWLIVIVVPFILLIFGKSMLVLGILMALSYLFMMFVFFPKRIKSFLFFNEEQENKKKLIACGLQIFSLSLLVPLVNYGAFSWLLSGFAFSIAFLISGFAVSLTGLLFEKSTVGLGVFFGGLITMLWSSWFLAYFYFNSAVILVQLVGVATLMLYWWSKRLYDRRYA